MKIIVFGNLFKLFRLAITFAREVCHSGDKDEKKYDKSYSSHYTQWIIELGAVREVSVEGFQSYLHFL